MKEIKLKFYGLKDVKALFTSEFFKCATYVLALSIFNIIWFYQLAAKGSIAFDDEWLVSLIQHPKFFWKLLVVHIFRPIFYLVIFPLGRIFGADYASYFAFNLFFNSIIIASIFYIVYSICERYKYLLSTFVSFIYIISIYSYYGITQVTGLMELMCVFFCIWCFYFLFRFMDTKSNKFYVLSVLMYFFVMNTHERFLAIYGVYLILNIFILFDEDIIYRLKRLIFASIPTLLFLFIKICVLHTKLFVGSGQIPMEFNVKQTLYFTSRTIMSLFGIHSLPEGYLFGYIFDWYSLFHKILVVILLVVGVTIFLLFVYQHIIKDRGNRRMELQKFFVFFFFMGATIICFTLSTRIEMRQFYVPYSILLIYLACCASKIRFHFKYVLEICGLFCTVVTLWNSSLFRKNLDMIYFAYGMKLEQAIYRTIVLGAYDWQEWKYYIDNDRDLIGGIGVRVRYDMFEMYGFDNVDYTIIENYQVANEQIKNDLQNGKKVKVIYRKYNPFFIEALRFTDSNSEVNLETQIVH